jgi:hypothetical protein
MLSNTVEHVEVPNRLLVAVYGTVVCGTKYATTWHPPQPYGIRH